MPQQRLPPEIACMALQYLYDDTKTLRKCSLVQKSWRHDAQKLLFGECFVRIGVPEDVRSFPLEKNGGKRSPSEFVARIKKSPHLAKDIRAVRIHLADMHRLITNSQGEDAWTLANLLAPLIDTNVDKLETLAFFSCARDRLRDFYRQDVYFPSILLPQPFLEKHFGSVTRLELQSCLWFSNLRTLQELLCSLPALVEFVFCPIIEWGNNVEPPNPPTNLSLRQLTYDDHEANAYMENCEAFMKWLATTGTRDSLEHFTVDGRGNLAKFHPLLGAVTKPFSMEILNARAGERE
jgi:hypothetical protein